MKGGHIATSNLLYLDSYRSHYLLNSEHYLILLVKHKKTNRTSLSKTNLLRAGILYHNLEFTQK